MKNRLNLWFNPQLNLLVSKTKTLKNKKKPSVFNSPIFAAIRWRLMLSYLGVMVTIIGSSTVVLYEFVSYSLYQKIDRNLIRLADAAAHSLPAIQNDSNALTKTIYPPLDNDGDLDIPWQNLKQSLQSIEWFDANKNLLGQAGKTFIEIPITPNFYTYQTEKIRTLTIPIYSQEKPKTQKTLQGYVRVSESIEEIEEELDILLWGFEWGGLLALTLTGIGGWWLTKQSLKPVEQSYQQLQQFTADASHELRSPLTVIKSSLEVIQSHPERIHPSDIKKISAIASASQQMSRLVEDLLLLTRSDKTSPNTDLQLVKIPIEEMLEDILYVLESQAEEKQISIQFEPSPNIFTKAEPLSLKRLFYNLIENAIQYTPSGGIITVSMFNLERWVTISIQDTGIGIAPQDLKFIFDRFWRADKARNYRQGGTGLGLSIAQAIAHQHGGEINVTSELGKGTCFRVRLPIFY